MGADEGPSCTQILQQLLRTEPLPVSARWPATEPALGPARGEFLGHHTNSEEERGEDESENLARAAETTRGAAAVGGAPPRGQPLGQGRVATMEWWYGDSIKRWLSGGAGLGQDPGSVGKNQDLLREWCRAGGGSSADLWQAPGGHGCPDDRADSPCAAEALHEVLSARAELVDGHGEGSDADATTGTWAQPPYGQRTPVNWQPEYWGPTGVQEAWRPGDEAEYVPGPYAVGPCPYAVGPQDVVAMRHPFEGRTESASCSSMMPGVAAVPGAYAGGLPGSLPERGAFFDGDPATPHDGSSPFDLRMSWSGHHWGPFADGQWQSADGVGLCVSPDARANAGHAEGRGAPEGRSRGARARKPKFHNAVPRSVNLTEKYAFHSNEEVVTTLMVRNVPNSYTRGMLMSEFDALGFHGRYDFMYLPIDSATQWNVGYAFINLEDPDTAMDFARVLAGYHFQHHDGWKRKLAQVSPAHIQGLERNLDHLRSTALLSNTSSAQRPWIKHPGEVDGGTRRDGVERDHRAVEL